MAFLCRLGIFIRHAKILHDPLGVAVAADRDVPGECRDTAFEDIDIHDTRTNVYKGGQLVRQCFIIHAVHVFDRECIDIHDFGNQSRFSHGIGIVVQLILLGRHEEYGHYWLPFSRAFLGA